MIFTGITIRTKDVQRLANFYKNILCTSSDCDDDSHQSINVKGAYLGILRIEKSDDMRNDVINLAFEVDDVDVEFERLKCLGINIIKPPTVRPWGVKNIMFADPDGNDIVFNSSHK